MKTGMSLRGCHAPVKGCHKMSQPKRTDKNQRIPVSGGLIQPGMTLAIPPLPQIIMRDNLRA
jgi:hypothetical protein